MKNIEKGQSFIEAAFGLVIIAFLLMGMVDFGRVYLTWVALEDAAGEAAIYLAIDPSCAYDDIVDGQPVASNGIPDGCDAPNNATWRAENATGGTFDFIDNLTVKEVTSRGGETGNLISVTLEYKVNLITPVITDIVGLGEVTLTSTATQTVVCEASCK